MWNEVLVFPIVWGALFGGIPTLMGAIFVVIGIATLLFPFALAGIGMTLVFGGIGGAVAARGLWLGRRRLQLIRDGRPAIATIAACSLDPSQTHDGVNPWSVQYVFEVDGGPIGGAASFWNPVASRFEAGDRLHVLYDPADPSRSLPWPPP